MGQLLTQKAACEYLKQQCGSMSVHTFIREVQAGRIPVKAFGRSKRYRIEDLDAWQNITKTHSDYSNGAKYGMRISRSLLVDGELSFVKRLGVKTKTMPKLGVRNV